jgi:hypothetical protein
MGAFSTAELHKAASHALDVGMPAVPMESFNYLMELLVGHSPAQISHWAVQYPVR